MGLKRVVKWVGATIAVVVLAFAGIVALDSLRGGGGHGGLRLPVKHTAAFHPKAAYPPLLRVSGNRLVAAGKPVLLRGVMPVEPARLHDQGKQTRDFLHGIKAAGANVVRIGVHPEYWVRDREYLWRHLDPLVHWAGEEGLYAILDLHYIGNPVTGAGPEMPDTGRAVGELTHEFWKAVAVHFEKAPHVIFELFNEPALVEPGAWRSAAADLVSLIRSLGAGQVVIVGGSEYSRDLSWVLEAPVAGENIAYAAHVFPHHPPSTWGYFFGRAAESVPVIVTEWGFMDEDRAGGPAYLGGSAESFGKPLLAYLERLGVGWVAAWYDDRWHAPMFRRDGSRTNFGDFVLDALASPPLRH